MNKQTFDQVKAILTTHRYWANDSYYSLSLQSITIYDDGYYRIEVYSNNERGSFHDGFASFFCQVADVTGCSCSFGSVNNVCVCKFY